MEALSLVVLAALAATAWFAWDSLRAREAANQAMRAACNARGWLFLDDTVALLSVRPARDDEGRMRLRRVFQFAYSGTGFDRRNGVVELMGSAIAVVALEGEPPP